MTDTERAELDLVQQTVLHIADKLTLTDMLFDESGCISSVDAAVSQVINGLLSSEIGLKHLMNLVNAHKLVRHQGRLTISSSGFVFFTPYTRQDKPEC